MSQKIIKQSELNRLCQQLHDLREALRPFAAVGALVPIGAEGPLLHAGIGQSRTILTLAHFRRAAAVLKSLEDEDTQRWVKDAEEKMGQPHAVGCVRCGQLKSEDGSPVTWRCSQCNELVCREHTLTIPGRFPKEYFHDTLCSIECWQKAGCPDE